ncbi:MAG TPA: hypothetical protein PLZ99_01085 [Parcubacteria group bacterium]|jgi:hypothetical protein|nr:hypothetical protein [Parcubacteria group bacterium]
MKQTKFVATEESVKAHLDEFVGERAKAIGLNEGRPRFANFKVIDEIAKLFVDAVNAWKAGNFVYADKKVKEALRSLRGAQRAYCVKSASVFFPSRVEYLRDRVDQDLFGKIERGFKDFQVFTSGMSHDNFDLDAASLAYWSLLDAIEKAPVEQEARDANARMLAKTGRASRKQMKRMEKQEEEIRQAELARDQAQQAREARENARKAAADSYLDAISA